MRCSTSLGDILFDAPPVQRLLDFVGSPIVEILEPLAASLNGKLQGLHLTLDLQREADPLSAIIAVHPQRSALKRARREDKLVLLFSCCDAAAPPRPQVLRWSEDRAPWRPLTTCAPAEVTPCAAQLASMGLLTIAVQSVPSDRGASDGMSLRDKWAQDPAILRLQTLCCGGRVSRSPAAVAACFNAALNRLLRNGPDAGPGIGEARSVAAAIAAIPRRGELRAVIQSLALAAHRRRCSIIQLASVRTVVASTRVAEALWFLARSGRLLPLEPHGRGIAFAHISIQELLAAKALGSAVFRETYLEDPWWQPVVVFAVATAQNPESALDAIAAKRTPLAPGAAVGFCDATGHNWQAGVVVEDHGHSVHVSRTDRRSFEEVVDRSQVRRVEDSAASLVRCAARVGDVALVEGLMARNVDVVASASAVTRDTALHEAARYGHPDVAQALVQAGGSSLSHRTGAPRLSDNARGQDPAVLAQSPVLPPAIRAALQRAFYPPLCDIELDLALGGSKVPCSKRGRDGNHYPRASVSAAVSLARACRVGDLGHVRQLLAEGLSVGAVIADGTCSPLHFAAAEGHAAVVELLLEHGAFVSHEDARGTTPLMLACRFGHSAVAQVLLSYPGRAQTCPRGQRTLVAREVSAEESRAIWVGLMLASYGGFLETVQTLLDCGADVQQARDNGCTALMYACQNGHADVAFLLLNRGVDVSQANADGSTALIAACKNGHADVAQLLLESGAIVGQAQRDGGTALMFACMSGHVAVARLLLDAHADVGAVAQDGWTALVGAAWSGRVELVSLLLDARATVNVRSTRECEGVPMGSTPLFIAKMRGHTAIADLLKRHGAVLE